MNQINTFALEDKQSLSSKPAVPSILEFLASEKSNKGTPSTVPFERPLNMEQSFDESETHFLAKQ